MKLFLVIFFVGCASALTHEVLKKASDDAVADFLIGMTNAPALHEALGIPDSDEVRRLESSLKEELEKFIREAFDKTLEKIKKAMDNGNEIHKEAWQQLLDLKEKMKDLNIRESDFEKEQLEQIKDKISQQLKTLLEKFGVLDDDKKRSVDFEEMMAAEDDIFGDLSFRNFILRLKEMILEKMNVDTLKKGLAKAVGQGAKALCEWLTVKGKDKVLNFFDRVLESDEDRKRSVSDFYEHIKEYFDEMDLDFKQKFAKFGEWVMEVLEKGLDKSKNKIQNVRLIAKQLLEKSKTITRDVAKQGLEYLKDYKQELGELYEKVHEKLMEKIMENTD